MQLELRVSLNERSLNNADLPPLSRLLYFTGSNFTMELLKNPQNLQRAVSLLQQTQATRSTMLVKQAQSARNLLATTAGMAPRDLKSALKSGITALMTGVDDDKPEQPKTVRMAPTNNASVDRVAVHLHVLGYRRPENH